jgi:hypothetical protein
MKVAFSRLGQNVRCRKCGNSFVAGQAQAQPSGRSGDKGDGSPSPPSGGVERIAAVCPSCRATLHVRRAYVGNQVRCKYCEQVFRVLAPADIQSSTEPDRSRHERERLQVEHERLYVAHNLLQAEHDRLKTECDGLRVEVSRLKDDLALVGVQHRELQDRHASMERLCNEYQDRNQQLHVEQERLGALAQSAGQSLGPRLARNSDRAVELHVVSDQTGDESEPSNAVPLGSASDQRAPEPDLDELRAQVAELSNLLEESEHLNREMGAVLTGMGIRCLPTHT